MGSKGHGSYTYVSLLLSEHLQVAVYEGIPDRSSGDSRNNIDRIHGSLYYRRERTFRIWRSKKQPTTEIGSRTKEPLRARNRAKQKNIIYRTGGVLRKILPHYLVLA